MKEFKDSLGRSWNLSINLGKAKQVKDSIGVNILIPVAFDKPTESYLSVRLQTDDILLCEVVYELIRKEAEERKVSKDDFFESIKGESMVDMNKAFFDEYVDFFTARGKTYIKAVIEADREAIAKTATDMETAVQKLGLIK